MTSIEWLVLLSVIAVMVADSYYQPSGVRYYYTRFVPLGMLAGRSLLALGTRQVRINALPSLFLKPFTVLFLLALLSTLYSINPKMTFLRALTMGFVLLGFGIALPTYMKDEERLIHGLHVMVMIMALVAVAGVLAFPFTSRSVMDAGAYVRVRGVFTNPNTLGIMAMLTFFPLLGWWLQAPRGKRTLLSLLTVMVLGSMFVSGSRASVVGLLVGVLVFVGYGRLDFRSKVLLATAIGLAILFMLALPEVTSGLLRVDNGSRPVLWQWAFELGMRSPIWGVGFGTNDLFAQNVALLRGMGEAAAAAGPHNSFIRLFVGLGVTGVLIALVGFSGILLKTQRVIRTAAYPLVPLSLMAAILAGLTDAIFETWLFAFGGAEAIPFWFYLAVLALYVQQTSVKGQRGRAHKGASRMEGGRSRHRVHVRLRRGTDQPPKPLRRKPRSV